MDATTILAGDMGGTKTLLALYGLRDQTLSLLHSRRFISRDWSSLEPMLLTFLSDRPQQLRAPEHGCIAVAGPVREQRAKITNLPWKLQAGDLAAAASMLQLELVNDFAVLIYGLEHFSADQQITLQEGKTDDGPLAILGAGTGLGMAHGLRSSEGLIALPSEGGHREFAPRSEQEWQLALWIKKDLGLERLSIERVVSGTGLGHVANWLLHQPGSEGHPLRGVAEKWRHDIAVDLPAQAGLAAASGDALMQDALQVWLSAYGSAAGDLALQELCSGGLWVGGGTAAKQLQGLRSSCFLESMRDKGRFRDFICGLQVSAVIDPQAGLFSAACRARMLAESGGTLS